MAQLQRQNVRARISKAISLGLVTISLISLSLVSTPAGVTAAAGIIPAGIIPPIHPPPGQISPGPNCSTSYNPSDYPRYISKFNNSWANTVPTAINNLGQVAGYLQPVSNQGYKGFVRNVNGTFAPAPWFGPDFNVFLTGINDLGQFVGYHTDRDGFGHGFVRNAQGSETYFDVPDADSTTPTGINNLGQVIGTYRYSTWWGTYTYYAGFVRETNGHITYLGNGYYPEAINNLGQIVGYYFGGGVFVRDAQGSITIVNPHDFSPGKDVIIAESSIAINDLGQIVGIYSDYSLNNLGVVFVRDANGRLTTFPGPVGPGSDGTRTPGFVYQVSINNLGEVAGTYLDGQDQSRTHWFVRNAQGSVTTFAFPGTAEGMSNINMINDLGQVAGAYRAGAYQDGAGIYGFVTGPVFVEPFAQFSVTRTDIVPNAGAITVFGSFTTCPGRTINPVADPVLVKLYQTGAAPAWASIAIPRGSLQLSAGRYVYQGVLHGVPVTVHLYPHSGGSWDFAVYAAGVSGLPSTNPVTVLLAIGDNTAASTVTATIH
jgi:hypothetical protein